MFHDMVNQYRGMFHGWSTNMLRHQHWQDRNQHDSRDYGDPNGHHTGHPQLQSPRFFDDVTDDVEV